MRGKFVDALQWERLKSKLNDVNRNNERKNCVGSGHTQRHCKTTINMAIRSKVALKAISEKEIAMASGISDVYCNNINNISSVGGDDDDCDSDKYIKGNLTLV